MYTSTPPAPIPTSVPVLGFCPTSAESMSSGESLTLAMESQDIPMSTPKCCHITPTPVQSSDSLMPFSSSTALGPPTKAASYPVVVVSKLEIPAGAYPKHLNWHGGSKEYLRHLCTFRHSNLDCILAPSRKYRDIRIGCPVC